MATRQWTAPAVKLARRIPLVGTLDGYRRTDLRFDLIAGITVAAILIPSGLAYGELAGLTPVAGLYTGLFGMLGYALIASSRVQIIGPESQMSILVAAALAPIALGDPSRYAKLAATMCFLAAALFIVAAILRLGFLADYLSQPVLVGYFTGVAFIIIVNQLAKLFGYKTGGDTLLDLTRGLITGISGFSATSFAVGAATIAVLVAIKRFAPALPGSLIAVIVFTVASAVLNLRSHGVSVVGHVPAGLPTPALPDFRIGDILRILPSAVGISLVVFADAILSARSYANRDGYRINPNQEIAALAAANILAGLFRGFNIGASDSRTAVNHSAGARSQVSALIAAAVTAVFLLALTPLVTDLPSPTLAGVVIVAAFTLIRPKDFKRLYDFRRFEMILAIVTILGVATLGILPGILAAVAINLGELVFRLSRPAVSVLGPVAGSTRWRSQPRDEAAKAEPGILVLRYGGPLFFANSDFVVTAARREIRKRGPGLRWVVLDAEAITLVDTNGIQSLQQLAEVAEKVGVRLVIARADSNLIDLLERTSLPATIGPDRFYDRVEDAVRAFHARTAD